MRISQWGKIVSRHNFLRVYSKDDRFRLIANNPVAGAHFFKFIVELFISSVLDTLLVYLVI